MPVFDPAQNDPSTPDYLVRKAEVFSVMRKSAGNNYPPRLFIQPNLKFPFSGALIEVGQNEQFHSFLDLPISRMHEEKFYEVDIPTLPYLETDFKLRMYHIHEGDTLFSEPDTAKLYQSIFDFEIEESGDQIIVSFSNNFVDRYEVNFYTKEMDSLVYLGSSFVTLNSERFNSVSIDSILFSSTDDLYYEINISSEPYEDLVLINFERNGCYEKIGNNIFFIPDDLIFSRNNAEEEGIFSWSDDCEYDELRVYWNIDRGYRRYYEYYPMQKLYNTTEKTQEIKFDIKWNVPRSFVWLTAVVNGKETELTLPGWVF